MTKYSFEKTLIELRRALIKYVAQVVAVLESDGFSIEVSEQGHATALINREHIPFDIEGANPKGRDAEAASAPSNGLMVLRRSRDT